MSERPKMLRYCDNEEQLHRELAAARLVSSAISILYDALKQSCHHIAIAEIGAALTAARSAHAHLEKHCEFYYGPETRPSNKEST